MKRREEKREEGIGIGSGEIDHCLFIHPGFISFPFFFFFQSSYIRVNGGVLGLARDQKLSIA